MSEKNNPLVIDSKIFNVDKTQYQGNPIFLGEDNGLFDTVNVTVPRFTQLFEVLRASDWSETDFDFSTCAVDFKNADKSIYEIMMLNLGFQWEGDTMAARSIAPTVAHFITNDELWSLWVRISDNENLHARTYSEIVRNSFDNPQVVIEEVLKVKESLTRLSTIADIMSETREIGLKYSLGLVENNQETYNAIFSYTVALLYLERIQFMVSFLSTASVAACTDAFGQINKAVQRIAKDELEIHVETDLEVIRQCLTTERGRIAYEQTKPRLAKALNEVIRVECEWSDFLYSDGRSLPGMTNAISKQWVIYNAAPVADFLGYDISDETLEMTGPIPVKNPCKFMEKWLDINSFQASPQEEENGNYKVNILDRKEESGEFEFDFDL